jgi:hypothetical protein
MSINYKVIYVPVSNNKNLLYPIYVPVVVNDVDTLLSSGKLSENDYYQTLKINDKCGFPIAPLLAALAPMVIPGLIKGAKKLFNRNKSNGNLIPYNIKTSGYIPTNPNIKSLKQLQNLYDKYN